MFYTDYPTALARAVRSAHAGNAPQVVAMQPDGTFCYWHQEVWTASAPIGGELAVAIIVPSTLCAADALKVYEAIKLGVGNG